MQIGVVLAQLGTPEAPTAKALRPYLRQFLSDRRVIDYPPVIWQPLLRGLILRLRPRRSARMYARIWTENGSPLMVHSQRQAKALQEGLGSAYAVALGMTYGNPSIASALNLLEAQGIERIIVLPMFPQYSSTTSACIYDAVFRAAQGNMPRFSMRLKRNFPALRFIAPFYDHPKYIDVMAQHLRQQTDSSALPPDIFVLSFHGIPNRYIEDGDPYRKHCERTAGLLAEAMGWRDDEWTLSYQSRFGPEPWLEPYTEDLLQSLAKRGKKRPLIFAPGFLTDCLETLDELGIEGRELFAEGGGDEDQFQLAPCLNTKPAFMDMLADLVRSNAAGWINDATDRRKASIPQFAADPL